MHRIYRIKKALSCPSWFIPTLILLVLLQVGRPAGVASAAGITWENVGAEYSFAQRITFRISARSDAGIQSAVVVFRAGSGPEKSGTATFTPGKAVEAVYVEELRGGVFPPFSTVTYRWELTDAAGQKATTPPQTIDYFDNRFTWQETSDGNLHVHTYSGDNAYARAAVDTARAALPRINQEFQAPLPGRIDIFLYAALDDLQSAMLLAGRDWQGGQARPELGVVLVAIPPGQEALSQMRRDIPHELTHLLVYQATGSGSRQVPHWLDEGLASANEELAQPAYQIALEEAVRSQSVIPLETLCAPFSSDAGIAQLSYAESLSVVQFIRNHYPTGIHKLLGAYAGGATCSGGVEQALGRTLGALELEWRASLSPQGAWLTLAESVGPWVLLALLLPLALLPWAFAAGRRRAIARGKLVTAKPVTNSAQPRK